MSEQYEPVYGDWQLAREQYQVTANPPSCSIATHHGHAINVNCQCVIPCAMCEHVLKKCQDDNARACAPSALFLISLICDLGISAALWDAFPLCYPFQYSLAKLHRPIIDGAVTKCIR